MSGIVTSTVGRECNVNGRLPNTSGIVTSTAGRECNVNSGQPNTSGIVTSIVPCTKCSMTTCIQRCIATWQSHQIYAYTHKCGCLYTQARIVSRVSQTGQQFFISDDYPVHAFVISGDSIRLLIWGYNGNNPTGAIAVLFNLRWNGR